MPYVTSKKMLMKARKEGYAIPSCNSENMEFVRAIIEAAVLENSPIMLQMGPKTVEYCNEYIASGMVKMIAEKTDIPIVLHLDHGTLEAVEIAARAGFSSLMLDGSALSFDENVRVTKEAKRIADIHNVPLEAEIGRIAGFKEDGSRVDEKDSRMTDPEEAKEFVRLTKCDFLAVAIGNIHGFSPQPPVLDIEQLRKIANAIDIPLVLHGGTGTPEQMIKDTIGCGVAKLNVGTIFFDTFTKVSRKVLDADKDRTIIDPKIFLVEARNALVDVARSSMRLTGSSGKA